MKRIILLFFIGILCMSCEKEREITKKEKEKILAELSQIDFIDQKYAGIPPADLREKYGNQKAWEIFKQKRDSVGIDNQNRIRRLYKDYGYLGEKKIGEEASTSFWLPIQHADNDIPFQQEMLKAMKKEIEKGSTDKYHYAMLEDRINVNLKKPQRFGSQLTYNNKGQAIPKIGIIDSTIVDSLRKAYELPNLKEYYNGMTEMHFEMNKKMFLEKGITEPQLYK
ncbi:DUF6624 domain-containing protein [Urechidicola sp. KH5]